MRPAFLRGVFADTLRAGSENIVVFIERYDCMIHKLTAADNHNVMKILHCDRERNAFVINDIMNYGYTSEIVDVWGSFAHSGELEAVLLRYDNFFLCSAMIDCDCAAFLPVINSYPQYESVSGAPEVIRKLAQPLGQQCRLKNYMRLDKLPQELAASSTIVRTATLEEIELVDDLLVSVEFGFSRGEIAARYRRTVSRNEARYFVVEQDGMFVACAATAAETEISAVIVSVCCRKEYRRRGYAEACMRALCETLSAEGKQLYLFFENPAAGAMYKKLGFETIGEWAMIETEGY